MSKQQVQPVITTEYFDEVSQDYFKKNPDVLTDKRLQEYEVFTANLIAAIAEVSRVNKPTRQPGITRPKNDADRDGDFQRLKGILKDYNSGFLQALYQSITRGISDTDLAKDLCEHFLSLPKAAAPGLAVLLGNVRNGGARGGEVLGEVTKEGDILREDLREVLWSQEGKLTELRFRAAGYGKTRSDFYMQEFRQAEYLPDSRNRYMIPVSAADKDGLVERIKKCKDKKGKEIFEVGDYEPASGKLEIKIAYPTKVVDLITDPINLALKAVNGLKSGPQAAAHVRPVIKKSDLAAEHVVGAIINAPTAWLPAIPVVSYGVGFFSAMGHETPMGQVPVLGEISYLLAKGGLALAEFCGKRGNFLAGTKMLKDFSRNAEDRVNDIEKRERKIIQSSKLPVVRAATGVIFGVGVASVCRGTEIACNALGDVVGYGAKYCLEAAKKPVENPIQHVRKLGYLGYYFLSGISLIPKVPGFIAKKCGDACATTADRFEDKRGFGWIAGASKAMKEGADSARFFKGQGRSTVADLKGKATPNLGEENDMFPKARDVLNNAKGLKFDQSSGIKGDNLIYALLGEVVTHDGKTYKVLGSSNGQTITIKGAGSDNVVGGLPASLVLLGAKDSANITAFREALNTEMDLRIDLESRGVSLTQFRDSFKEEPSSQQAAAQHLLVTCGVSLDFKPGHKLISKEKEFKLKKSSTDEFSFEKKGSGKPVDFESTAFFNFLQEAAKGETSVANSLTNKVANPRSANQVVAGSRQFSQSGSEIY